MAAEGVFPKVDGDIMYGKDANMAYGDPQIVYTGTDYDLAADGTNNHTLTIAAGEINSHVFIQPTYKVRNIFTGTTVWYSVLKIETSEKDADSWTTLLDSEICLAGYISGGPTYHIGSGSNSASLNLYYLPTADEKTNGLDVRFTVTITGESSGSATFNNIQTLIMVH